MTKLTLRSALLLSACLVPLAATAYAGDYDVDDIAQATQSEAKPVSFDNEVWAGVHWQSGSSAQYGRYTGTPYNGTTGVSGFSINDRAAWDSGETSYFQATGDNLSFDSNYFVPNSSVLVKFGQQGSWGITSFFDSTPYIQSLRFNTAYATSGTLLSGTPYTVSSGGVGSGGFSMAGIGTGAGNTAADQTLSNSAARILTQRTVGTQRDKVGSSLNYLLPNSNWSFTTAFQHEHKEGTVENSMLLGTSTSLNNAGGSIVYFPQPVDYDTDRFDASLAYNVKDLQNQFSYTLSRFVDNNLDFRAQDPFRTTNLAPGFQSADYALPPGNIAHQIKDQFGYNITPRTRFNANLGYGVQFQNSAYAQETINPYVALPSGPGTSADGLLQNIFANGVLTSRPFTAADFKASFTYNSRDNESARKSYYSMKNDAINCTTTVKTGCSGFLSNAPYSFRTAGGTLEGGYRVFLSTKLTIGDTYEDKLRDFSAANQNHENTVYARINSTLADDLHGSVGASNAVRTASGYYGGAGFAALDINEMTQLEALSLMHFSEAARNRREIKGTLTWSPTPDLALSLTSKYYIDHYPDSPFGITRDHTIEIDPDVSFSPIKDVATHFFYSFEEINYFLNDANSGTAVSQWNLNTQNNVHTVGTTADWQANNDLKLGMGYTCQFGSTVFNQNAWGAPITNYTPVSQLPSNNSMLSSLSLHGEYALQDNIMITAGYAFERFITKDYLYNQQATSAQYATYLLPGEGNPSYANHVVTTSIHFKF